MNIDLAQMTRRARNPRRTSIVIRDIVPPTMLATDLYRAVYAPVVAIWDRAGSSIIAEYQRTADVNHSAAMTAPLASASQSDSNPARARFRDSAADIQASIDAAQSEFERLVLQLTAALDRWGISTERWSRNKWRDAVLAATGVDLGTLIGPEDVRATIAQYLEWNTALIRDVSAQARQRISNAVFSGLQNNAPVRDVARDIREATGMARRRSIGIAADQSSKITSALAAERRRQVGLTIYKYRHSGKRHPRAEHVARNGKLYGETRADAGGEVDGQRVNDPIPQGRRAGQEPWCGCREQGVLVLSDD